MIYQHGQHEIAAKKARGIDSKSQRLDVSTLAFMVLNRDAVDLPEPTKGTRARRPGFKRLMRSSLCGLVTKGERL